MPVKVTLFLTQDKYSWSEDHYWNGGSNVEAAVGSAVQLAALRVPCLGLGCALRTIRCSDVPANERVSDVEALNGSTPDWLVNPLLTNIARPYWAARAFSALQLRFNDNQGNHRNYYMGGVPSGIQRTVPGAETGVDFAGVNGFQERLSALIGYLLSTSSPWGWLSRTFTNGVQCQGLVTNAAFPGMIGVQVAFQVPGIVLGGQVLVDGWRRVDIKAGARLSGAYRVGAILPPAAPATVWTYFLLNTSRIVPTNFKSLGLIGQLILGFTQYWSIATIQTTQRKRGATAYRPRGRRPLSSF